MVMVMSYCGASSLAALSAASKWLDVLAKVELQGHRDGIAILRWNDSLQPFGWDSMVWSWAPSTTNGVPSTRVDLCGLYVKRQYPINGCDSYFLAGHPLVMLWKTSSGPWIVGLKDARPYARGKDKDSCFMQGGRHLASGRWKIARRQKSGQGRSSWQFVPAVMKVVGSGASARTAVIRYKIARNDFLSQHPLILSQLVRHKWANSHFAVGQEEAIFSVFSITYGGIGPALD
jgi:hypothetical protein